MASFSPFILLTIRREGNTKQHKLNTQHAEDVVKGRALTIASEADHRVTGRGLTP